MSPVFAGTVSLCLSQGPSAWLDSRLLGSTEAGGYTYGTACGLLAFRISFHLSIQRCPTPLLCYRSHFLPHSSLTSALPPQLSSFGPSSSPTPPKRKFPQKNPGVPGLACTLTKPSRSHANNSQQAGSFPVSLPVFSHLS